MATTRRNTAERRASILKTALRVFSRDGFHNADVQVIADDAGVGKGTVYRHFGNKEKLFLATSRHCMELLNVFVRERMGDDNLVAGHVQASGSAHILMEAAVSCAEFYQEQPEAVEIMLHERAEFRDKVPTHLMFRSETRNTIDELVKHAAETGDFRNVDVREATNAWCDLIFGCVVSGCLEGTPTKLEQRMRHAMDIFLNGLSAGSVNSNRS